MAIDGQLPQGLLTHVAKWRVTEIMGQPRCLGDVGVQSPERPDLVRVFSSDESFGQPPSELGDFKCVGEAIVEDVSLGCPDYLCDPR